MTDQNLNLDFSAALRKILSLEIQIDDATRSANHALRHLAHCKDELAELKADLTNGEDTPRRAQ